jgi:hypothetical protein
MFVRAIEWARGIKRLHSHARWVVREQGFGVEMVFRTMRKRRRLSGLYVLLVGTALCTGNNSPKMF